MDLRVLQTHISRVMKIESDCIPQITVEDESSQYLNLFLLYFINVKNYIQYEKQFKEYIETTDLIFAHLQHFSWTLINLYSNFTKDEIENKVVTVMQLVRIFSRLDEFATRIGEKGGIQLIMQAMKAFPFSMQLQINCSACLANLASIEGNREIMLDIGCIKYVLDNMSKFMKDPAVQAEICATLANLACHKVNAKYIIENNGCMLILKAMRLHLKHVDLQIQAFHAFSSLGKTCLHILDREDFLGLSIKSLTNHHQNVDLASACWHALGSLANSGMNITSYKNELLSLIFSVMKKFSDHPSFQITACFALAHMFFANREQVDEGIVSKQNGVELILNLMKKFPEQESLQTTALFAIGSIVMKSSVHRQTVFSNDGLQLIINAMRRAYSKGENSEEIEDRQTPEPVLYSRANSKIQCSKPLLLQLFGSVALLNLSECEKCREKIIDLGGIQCIFEASIRIFTKFTKCGENKTIYMVPKILPTLREITKTIVTNSFLEKLESYDVAEDSLKAYEKYRSYLAYAIDKHLLSYHMRAEVLSSVPCHQCRKSCFESHVRAFEITSTVTRNSLNYSFCSLNCAKMHKSYQDKAVFSYTPQIE
ncbi:hypothetical protein HDV01_006257 [Terramyces sp. JEL0728]|nr:hypothetical protein HDV01_006257 [Terramyces sp. JEL0728]